MKASTSFAKVVPFANKANGAQEALDDVSPAPRAPCRSLEARLSPTASVNPGSWEPQVSLALPANRESTSKGAIASIVLKGRRHGRGAHHERVVSRLRLTLVNQAMCLLSLALQMMAKHVHPLVWGSMRWEGLNQQLCPCLASQAQLHQSLLQHPH